MTGPAGKPEQDGKIACLCQKELDHLSGVWQAWAKSESAPARWIARARAHLFFLLARYGGLRAAEIFPFNAALQIDRQSGLLELNDRRLFLPPAALRPLRGILALPEAAESGFLAIDPGLLRRTFYNVANLAALPAACCAPRSLRYSRALELLNMHIPPQLVAKTLGMRNPQKLDTLLKWQAANPKRQLDNFENSCAAIVQRIEIGPQCGRVLFEPVPKLHLYCICSLDCILDAEPAVGQVARFHIPESAIFPAMHPLPAINTVEGKILSIEGDAIETRLTLLLGGALHLRARLDASISAFSTLAQGEKIAVNIPAHLIQMKSIT